jgi:hypothetical protein
MPVIFGLLPFLLVVNGEFGESEGNTRVLDVKKSSDNDMQETILRMNSKLEEIEGVVSSLYKQGEATLARLESMERQNIRLGNHLMHPQAGAPGLIPVQAGSASWGTAATWFDKNIVPKAGFFLICFIFFAMSMACFWCIMRADTLLAETTEFLGMKSNSPHCPEQGVPEYESRRRRNREGGRSFDLDYDFVTPVRRRNAHDSPSTSRTEPPPVV